MSEDSPDDVLVLPLSGIKGATRPATSPVEKEVIELFEELRAPLFRYSRLPALLSRL